MPLQPSKETTGETKSYWLTKHHLRVLFVYGNQSNTEIYSVLNQNLQRKTLMSAAPILKI